MSNDIIYPRNVAYIPLEVKERTNQFFVAVKQMVDTDELADMVDESLVKLVRQGICTQAHKDNNTPLHEAAGRGYCKTIEALLEKGVYVDVEGGHQEVSPLVNAGRYGQIKAMTILMDKGADKNISANGCNLLSRVIDNRQFEAVELLIAKGADVNNSQTIALNTALQHGLKDFVKFLIDKGANPEAIGWLPLHLAAMRGDNEEIKKLLASGADIHAIPKFTHILQSGLGWAPVSIAVIYDNHETVRFLLENGADRGATTEVGLPLLHLAARYASVQSIAELVGMGFDVNERNEEGLAPLHIISGEYQYRTPFFDGPARVVKALFDNGADLDAKDAVGSSCMILASAGIQYNGWPGDNRGYRIELVGALLDRGANIYVCNDNNRFAYEQLDEWELQNRVASLRKVYGSFVENRKVIESVEVFYKLLSGCIPESLSMPIDREMNLRKIVLHPKWKNWEEPRKLLEQLQARGEKVDVEEMLQKISFVRGWRERMRDEIASAGRMV